MKKILQRFNIAMIMLTLAIMVFLSNASKVHAMAFTYDAYPPNRSGTTITGWANLSRDCSGTYGCYNYIKIERSSWRGWLWVNGNWAPNSGWNSISANLLSGCYDYRTTVDSYNDTLRNLGIGENIGPVGFTVSGETIYRFHRVWSSGSVRYCR